VKQLAHDVLPQRAPPLGKTGGAGRQLNLRTSSSVENLCDFIAPQFPPGTPQGSRERLVYGALRTENALLKEVLVELRKRNNEPTVCIDDLPTMKSTDALLTPKRGRPSGRNPFHDHPGSMLEIKPGHYSFGDPYADRGDYPRKSALSVLRGLEHEIRVHDDEHVTWCIRQFIDADPDLGGEETLDRDIAPGVRSIEVAARVPSDDANCGAMVAPQPGFQVGPTTVWVKSKNTEGGYSGTRGKGEWMVPDVDETDLHGLHGLHSLAGTRRKRKPLRHGDCRVLFLHGGSYEWYSGVDEYYRPLASRIARESGMPVLTIDYRMAPEYKAPAGIEDALQALRWMQHHGPDGPSPARKLFVCGDSSGGGMSLAVLLAARDGLPGSYHSSTEAIPPVHGAVAICPLTDLTYDFRRSPANSYRTRIWDLSTRTGDPVFTASLGNLMKDMLDRQERARAYAGDMDLDDELLSPLFAKRWQGLPPMMLLAADEDLSVDDAVDLAARASAAGIELDLEVWPRMWHDWVMCTEGRDMYGHKPPDKPLQEAVLALKHAGLYLQRLAARP
jgi:acetyl esterase/lipase